jgi:acetyl esterase/lipase
VHGHAVDALGRLRRLTYTLARRLLKALRMRNVLFVIPFIVAACDATDRNPGDPAPDATPPPTPDAAAGWIADPGLEGPRFTLDDPTCIAAADRIECTDVPYSVVDGATLHLDLHAPLVARTQPVPVIVYLHGGGWSLGTYHARGLDIDGYLAQGYAVASVEYRLTLGPDHQTPSGIVFPQNLQDVKTAFRWIRTKGADVLDGDHIVAYGFSAGAHLAGLAGDTAHVAAFEGRGDPAIPSTVAGVVALSAAIDFHLFVPENPPLAETCPPQDPAGQTPGEAITLLIGGDFAAPENSQKLTDLSPMTYLDATAAPTLYFAGTCDQTVPYHGAEEIAQLARDLGVTQVDSFINEGAFHGGTLGSPEAKARLTAFIAEVMAP